MNHSPNSIHESYWTSDHPLTQQYPPLMDTRQCDVCVIGGGITGLSVALELLQRGRRVTVCEASVLGSGTTGGSTGHLDASPEIGASEMLRKLGQENASLCVTARRDAIGAIEYRGADCCDVRRIAAYRYSESAQDEDQLREDCESARKLGLQVQWQEFIPFPRAACGYRIERMARINALAYVRRLAQMVTQLGGQIFEKSPVHSHPESNGFRLDAGDGHVEYEHVVAAAHCNFSSSALLDMRLPPYQSYAIVARVKNPPPDAAYWDNSNPYFYSRLAKSDSDLVMIGGCDHRTGDGDPVRAEADLESYTRDHFEVVEIVHRWSAELFQPTDNVPLIGKAPGSSNVWVTTGFSGIGLTWGTVAGWLVADGIVGRPGRLHQVLDPSRFSASVLMGTLSEQVSSAKSYARHVLPAKSIDPEKLRPGQGEVGNVDGRYTAICRDIDGVLHECDPTCSHMGGTVSWNAAEQTWDCPVHGGRFSRCGQRLYGPPSNGLAEPRKS